MNYPKRAFVLMLLVAPMICGGNSCSDFRLDALNKTLLRLKSGAQELSDNLATYQASCCTLGREAIEHREPACSCATTPITAAGVLSASGAYCLANDITGNIDATGLQVKIDLNGHTVTGNVTVGDHSYVYNGAVTETVTLGSYAHAEFLRLGVEGGAAGGLIGSASKSCLLNNIIFENSSSAVSIEGFSSIVLDHLVFKGDVEFANTNDVVVRRSQAYGSFSHDDSTLTKMYLYDVSLQGVCTVIGDATLASLGIWNSSLGFLSLTMSGAGTPVLTFNGSNFLNVLLFNAGDANFRSTGLIDSCTFQRLQLTRMKNIRCQNSLVKSPQPIGVDAAIFATNCEQITFDHVQVYAEAYQAFSISGGMNMLLKQCSGVSTSGLAAFEISSLLNVNLYECVAKNSSIGIALSTSTGSVIRCVAEACGQGFVDNTGVDMIFADNVSVANTTNYTGAFNPSSNPTTAVSWRNIENP